MQKLPEKKSRISQHICIRKDNKVFFTLLWRKDEGERIREKLGDSPWMRRRQEIMEMDVDEIEKEIKRTEEVKDTNLQTRAERAGVIVAVGYGVPSGKTARPMGSKLPWTLMVLGIVGLTLTSTALFIYELPLPQCQFFTL
jgi:hypothetical protein